MSIPIWEANPDSVRDTLLTAYVSGRRQWLQDYLPTLQEHGVDGEAVVVTGIHFLEIIRQGAINGTDHVFIRFWYGSQLFLW